VFEVIQQDLNRCSLRSRRRTAWWGFSARLFCALCQGALFSPVKERAGKLFAPAGSTRCFGELNPQAAFLSNWHIEVIAAKLASVAQGKFQRLIINLPPRHLKSLIASIVCPACLGRPFGLRVLLRCNEGGRPIPLRTLASRGGRFPIPIGSGPGGEAFDYPFAAGEVRPGARVTPE
jgi:hypothetical protein